MTDLKELVKAGGFKGELDDSPSIIEAYSHDASLFEIKPKLVECLNLSPDLSFGLTVKLNHQ
ncbi:hypothetical protein M1512_03465, partial [Patescibacteria group bacterium]|nr:hypothetical protein [Patescibacteria group bacterium]